MIESSINILTCDRKIFKIDFGVVIIEVVIHVKYPPSLGNGQRTDKVSSPYKRMKDGRRRTGHKVQTVITK